METMKTEKATGYAGIQAPELGPRPTSTTTGVLSRILGKVWESGHAYGVYDVTTPPLLASDGDWADGPARPWYSNRGPVKNLWWTAYHHGRRDGKTSGSVSA